MEGPFKTDYAKQIWIELASPAMESITGTDREPGLWTSHCYGHRKKLRTSSNYARNSHSLLSPRTQLFGCFKFVLGEM